jgi:SlyX protein
VEHIETKIAYLERANADLSDAVYRQQEELRAIRALLLAISSRIEAQQGLPTTYAPEDEKPPHY